jgi:hypothetical protein
MLAPALQRSTATRAVVELSRHDASRDRVQGTGDSEEREEGRGKREEGRGKREEGRGKREEGRGKREGGRGKREK